MSDLAAIRNLIDNVTGINVKYEPLERAHRFNIFSILRRGHEEVNLHSRFIAELLDPKGKHGHGSEFLKLFIQFIDNQESGGFQGQEISASVKVEKSFSIDLDTSGRIDIFIQTPSRLIVIENKIYASDQQAQLDRYYKFAKSFGLPLEPLVCYLTLQGDTPEDGTWSEEPTNGALRLLSYQNEIRAWLDACVERSALEPALRETISQYRLLIDRLTGNTMSKIHKEEVITAITRSQQSFEAAKAINSAWDVARTDGILKFWEKIEERLREIVGDPDGTRIQSVQKYSRKRIYDRVHNRKKTAYLDRGVMVTIGQYSEDIHICLYIELSARLGMIFGITMVDFTDADKPSRQINDQERFNDLRDAITPESFRSSNKWWLGLSALHDIPNLAEPEEPEVLELMLSEKRDEAVRTTMKQVENSLVSYITDRMSLAGSTVRWFLHSN